MKFSGQVDHTITYNRSNKNRNWIYFEIRELLKYKSILFIQIT